VLTARQAVPHETYVYFMDLLAKTVRYVGCWYYRFLFDLSVYAICRPLLWFCMHAEMKLLDAARRGTITCQ
jgi:hypothetical protein